MPFSFCTRPQKGVKAEEWIVDSGATTHMTWDKGVFVTYAAMEDMPSVQLDGTADRQPDEALVTAQPSSDLWQRLAHVNDKMLDLLNI